jgi:hypothetical protein
LGEGGPPEELELLLDELLPDEPEPPPPPPHAVIIIDNAATRQYPKTFGTDTLHPREFLLSMLYAPFVYYWHQGFPLLTLRTAHIAYIHRLWIGTS